MTTEKLNQNFSTAADKQYEDYKLRRPKGNYSGSRYRQDLTILGAFKTALKYERSQSNGRLILSWAYMESWTLHEDCLEWLILRPEFRPLFKKYPDVLAEAERRWKHIKTLIIKKA